MGVGARTLRFPPVYPLGEDGEVTPACRPTCKSSQRLDPRLLHRLKVGSGGCAQVAGRRRGQLGNQQHPHAAWHTFKKRVLFWTKVDQSACF